MTNKAPEKEMSQAEYLKNGGLKCPFCRSEKVDGHDIHFGAGTCKQEVSCLVCERQWTDEYVLKEYVKLD